MRLLPDFAAMARQAREFFGQQRFQNTYPENTLEYLSKGTFVVQKIEPTGNEDLGVTLREGTEHKRAWSLFESEVVDGPCISINRISKHRILGHGHRRSHSAVGPQTESFEQFEKRLEKREKAESASIDRLLEPNGIVDMAEKASRKLKHAESVPVQSITPAPVTASDSSDNSATGATLDPPSAPLAVNEDDFAPMQYDDGDPKVSVQSSVTTLAWLSCSARQVPQQGILISLTPQPQENRNRPICQKAPQIQRRGDLGEAAHHGDDN